MKINKESARKLLDAYNVLESLQVRLERLKADPEDRYPVVIQLTDSTKVSLSLTRVMVEDRLSFMITEVQQILLSLGGEP